jgi:hypothetical protein
VSHPAEDVIKALQGVTSALEALGVAHHIEGSFAVAAYGIPRASADVDVVAELRGEHVEALVEALHDAYYVSAEQAHDAIERRAPFNVIHLKTMMKVDIFVAEDRPFAEQEQARSRRLGLDPTGEVPPFLVKSPEDLVLRKLRWFRDGGESSERQWSDVLSVLRIRLNQMDLLYMEHWADDLGVRDLLDRALRDASSP